MGASPYSVAGTFFFVLAIFLPVEIDHKLAIFEILQN